MLYTILLIVTDLALGGVAIKLGRENKDSNKHMAEALVEMKDAVLEMKKMNGSIERRIERLELRVEVLEDAA